MMVRSDWGSMMDSFGIGGLNCHPRPFFRIGKYSGLRRKHKALGELLLRMTEWQDSVKKFFALREFALGGYYA